LTPREARFTFFFGRGGSTGLQVVDVAVTTSSTGRPEVAKKKTTKVTGLLHSREPVEGAEPACS